MTFDEKLRQALGETADERAARIRAVNKKHRFSASYKLWERKTIRDFRKGHVDKHWTLKKARRSVALITVAISVLIGTAVFAAVNMGRYSFEDHREYSVLHIESSPDDKTAIEEYYGLPEENGWETEDIDNKCSDLILIKYKRDEQSLIFSQELISEGSMGNINTENAAVESISVYEENDGFFIEFRNGDCGLYWIHDGYLFHLFGNLNKTELLDLAHSTKIIDFSKN